MTNKTDTLWNARTKQQWRLQLTPEQYKITREHGTERAFTGPYWDEKADGLYNCICCDNALFGSSQKFDSGSGWPSFFAPIQENAIKVYDDLSLVSPRTEVRCAQCDAHLGHVFPDGPHPTGLRYCINGHALNFLRR